MEAFGESVICVCVCIHWLVLLESVCGSVFVGGASWSHCHGRWISLTNMSLSTLLNPYEIFSTFKK